MPTVPLFGTGTNAKSENVSVQRRVNLYLEQPTDGDKSQTVYYTRPGLAPITRTVTEIAGYGHGTTPTGLMGIYVPQDSGGSVQPGDYLYTSYTGGFMLSSTLTTGSMIGGTYSVPGANISMAWNGERGFAVDGTRAYWMAPPALIVYSSDEVGIPWEWDGATSVCFIAGRFVCNVPESTGRFAWSPLYPGAGVDWDPLDYATAESSPDPLVAVAECRGELLLFGLSTIEFWAPSTGEEVFARVGGSGISWGLASRKSLAKNGDGMIFVGRNTMGERQVCLLNGYQVQVISTPGIDTALQVDHDFDNWTACCFTSGGHSFYVLNLNDTSWAFDLTTGVWAEWQTDGGRWAGQYMTTVWGVNLVSDYRSDTIYQIDHDTLTDNGQPLLREIVSRHVAVDQERATVDQVALDCETGVGLLSGQGSDPQIMLQISKDGGHTWGDEMWESLGARGEYLSRVVWNRLGRARDWLFKFRITDPVKVVVIAASLRMRK